MAGRPTYVHVAVSPLFDETGQAVGAIEAYRDVTAEKQLQGRLEAIYQLGRELTLLHDEATIVRRVLETAVDALRFEVASCGLVDEAAGELEYCYTVGAVPETTRLRLPLDGEKGIGVAVVRSGQAINLPDTTQDPRYVPGDWLARSELCVPMKVGERVIGVLNAESLEPHHFTSDDQQLLQTLADQAAVALENAHLYENLQAQMTALQEAQARLVQTEKLAAIGELVAGVAHELNNPLTSIIGFAQLLQYSDVSEEARRDLSKIVAQARRTSNIVRGLLDFARQRPPERKPVQINDVLAGTLDLLSYELRTHNVDWTTHFAPDLPLTMADPYQLQQVFVNLVNNARQAMSTAHGGGHLTITTELTPSTFINHRPGAAPVIRVIIQDDGPGIPPDELPRIFDPFFTTKPPGEGTGLGLSVCHGIVSEHGGHIWAESEPGQGATFFVELPVVAPETPRRITAADWVKKAVSSDTPESDSGTSKRILVIDDEIEILEVLVRVLQREGYRVDAATDGETALAFLTKTNYDLILCDVRMPGLSGPEVYRRVQAQNPDMARRIIFTSGDTISATIRSFLEKTGIPFLSKPFALADLVEKVREALESGEIASE